MPRYLTPLTPPLAVLCSLAALSFCAAPSAGAATTRGAQPVAHTARHSARRHHRRVKPASPHTTLTSTSPSSPSSTPSSPASTPSSTPAAAASVPAVCPDAQATPGTVPAAALQAAVICLTNQQRVHYGLPTFRDSPLLDSSAQLWTDTMVTTGIFTHGTDFAQRITNAGYNWSAAGENIATGYATPADAVTAWMGSLGHCQNILNPSYADIGIGINAAPVGTDVPNAATWTQDFGLTMGAPAPSTNTAPMNGCPYAN